MGKSEWTSIRVQLVDAIRKDDESALREFYRRHFPVVYRYVLCRVDGNHADAEEIVGDVFYQAFRDITSYNAESAPDAWLRGIARHRVLDFYRKNKRKPVIEFAFATFDEKLAQYLLDIESKLVDDAELRKEEISQVVELVLTDLPPDYELVLREKYLEDRTVKQIAERVDDTPKAVEARLHRARLAFRDAFRMLNQQLTPA